MEIKTIYNRILAIMFIAFIFGVMLMFLFSKKQKINDIENKQLAEMPKFKISKLDPFPTQFDAYFSDHFPYKNDIIKSLNRFNFTVNKESAFPDKVVVGDNGYLFIAGIPMEEYQGKSLFTRDQLNSILEELNYRRDFCNKNDAEFYFVIIPQKHTIYPEYIPLKYKFAKKKSVREQVENFLTKNKFPFIDPTEYIMSKKTDDTSLYFKTDNHWNSLGAFYGTQYIVNNIKKSFPKVKSLNLNDYTISNKGRKGGNLAQMLNLADEIKDIDIVLEPIFKSKAYDGTKHPYKSPDGFPYYWDFENVFENPEVNNLKIVIIRESFASFQRKFYKESFGHTVLIFDAWQHKLNKNIIESEKPDIVVIQILEDMLDGLLKYPAKDEKVEN